MNRPGMGLYLHSFPPQLPHYPAVTEPGPVCLDGIGVVRGGFEELALFCPSGSIPVVIDGDVGLAGLGARPYELALGASTPPQEALLLVFLRVSPIPPNSSTTRNHHSRARKERCSFSFLS